jgi:nanoRNase/pAp phosphatase (c-di-AMP/oligoRNAs hydrolase)
MSLSPVEQFAELVRKSEHPLILLPAHPSKDALASALALERFISASGKTATVVGDGLSAHIQELAFLGLPSDTLDSLSGTREFVLSFNTDRNRILGIRSEQDGNEFRIHITPERGTIDPRDFSFIPARLQYDVAFVIGSADKESLGSIYVENPDIFYEIPIADIDTSAGNERFGQVNLVDMTASSVSEILFESLLSVDPTRIGDAVAESLLTGIIAATDSFQRKNTTPKALQAASRLIELGADREKIVLALYKTQPFGVLKLWGRFMSALKWDEGLRLAYATLSLDDFIQSRTRPEDLPEILDKVRANFSSGTLFAAIYTETPAVSAIVVRTSESAIATTLAARIPGANLRGDMLSFALPYPTGTDAEAGLLDAIRRASEPGT